MSRIGNVGVFFRCDRTCVEGCCAKSTAKNMPSIIEANVPGLARDHRVGRDSVHCPDKQDKWA